MISILAARVEELQAKYDSLNQFDKSQSYKLLAKNTKLRADLEQVKLENIQLRADLVHTDYCTVCGHNGEADGCECDCEECKSVCLCYSCIEGRNFVWRGMKKEE